MLDWFKELVQGIKNCTLMTMDYLANKWLKSKVPHDRKLQKL